MVVPHGRLLKRFFRSHWSNIIGFGRLSSRFVIACRRDDCTFGDLRRNLGQRAILIVPVKRSDRSVTAGQRLEFAEPRVHLPEAAPKQHGDHLHAAVGMPVEELGDFPILEEVGRQEVRADQQQRDVRTFKGAVDPLSPVVADLNAIGRPDLNACNARDHLEVLHDLLLQLTIFRIETDEKLEGAAFRRGHLERVSPPLARAARSERGTLVAVG